MSTTPVEVPADVTDPLAPIELPGLPELEKEAEANERSIPIRPADMIRSLKSRIGNASAVQEDFDRLARILGSVFHYEYFVWLNELKDLYSPLDPDSDCEDLILGSRVRNKDSDERFLSTFEAALQRANYRPLTMDILEAAVRAPNETGLNVSPNFSSFEHLKVYIRGRASIRRISRNYRTRFRRREVILPGYSRMIVIIKFREGTKLDQYARSDVLYLRLFKDVAHVDLEMHLPEQGTRVRMRPIDKAQISSPLLTGIPMALYKIAFAAAFSPAIAVGLLAAPVTAGINSFFGFQRAKQKHLAHMIRNLYYLTLANNASVINRLVDSAEEEDFKEALLAYFFLWQNQDPEPWGQRRLDRAVDKYILETTGQEVNFEVGDATRKLLQLGLIQTDEDNRLRAVPIEEALEVLDRKWDNYFRYNVADSS